MRWGGEGKRAQKFPEVAKTERYFSQKIPAALKTLSIIVTGKSRKTKWLTYEKVDKKVIHNTPLLPPDTIRKTPNLCPILAL